MKIFELMKKYGHEQLIYFYDKETGLKGITAIHNTNLGPALGGTRLYNYETEEDALFDVLRLSQAMTYKAAAADLNCGGGKSVLLGDPSKVKSEAYFRAYGRYINVLNGRFYTGEDMNINEKDVEYMGMETNFVNGRASMSGNPAPMTAYGVYWGIKACAKEKWGDDSLTGKTIALQGLGAVGYSLGEYLISEGAKLIVTDIDREKVSRTVKEWNAETVHPDDIYQVECDIFSPNAGGAILNDETIPKLKCEIIAGAANNVLLDDEVHGNMLKTLGILYAPDFVINAGGVINVYQEFYPPYNQERAMQIVKEIYERLLRVFAYAKAHNVNTQIAAIKLAEERIDLISRIRRNYIPNSKHL